MCRFGMSPGRGSGPLCNLVDFVAIHDIELKVNNVFMENGINLQH